MSSSLKTRIACRFHVHCAAAYASRLFDRDARAHEEKARFLDENVLHGDSRLPEWMDLTIHGYCRLLVGLHYAMVLVSGRLDEYGGPGS